MKRITVALLAYRQEQFVGRAIASVLNQVCEPVEVLLSDDASPDGTFDVMQRMAAAYRGPHRVVLRRNPRNVGIGEHINELQRAASGQLIVMMAGDDESLPGRIARTAAAWDASGGRLDLIAGHLIDMSAEGDDLGTLRVDDLAQWPTLDHWAVRRPYIVGAAHAFTKRMFERFGPFAPGVAYEDQVNLLRALCGGGAVTLDEALVRYRRGGVSDRMRDFSGDAYLAWTRRQSIKHAALHRQWLADARTAGVLPLVEAATEREYQRELFVERLLTSSTWRERMALTARWASVDPAWRWRKLAYLSMPGLAARIRRWQAASKRRRRGDVR